MIFRSALFHLKPLHTETVSEFFLFKIIWGEMIRWWKESWKGLKFIYMLQESWKGFKVTYIYIYIYIVLLILWLVLTYTEQYISESTFWSFPLIHHCPLVWDCRIRQLHLSWLIRSRNKRILNVTLNKSDREASFIEHWLIWCTPPLALLPCVLWPTLVVPVRYSFICQI